MVVAQYWLIEIWIYVIIWAIVHLPLPSHNIEIGLFISWLLLVQGRGWWSWAVAQRMASIQTFRRACTIKIILHIWHGKNWELGIFLGITLMIELWTAANICKHPCEHLQTSLWKTFAELNLGFKIAFMKMRMKTMMMTERRFRESQRSSRASNDATFPCLNKP